MIRCKFKCDRISLNQYGAEIIMHPVLNGSEENAKFFQATPSGEMMLAVVSNETATANFQPGKEYFIDITPT